MINKVSTSSTRLLAAFAGRHIYLVQMASDLYYSTVHVYLCFLSEEVCRRKWKGLRDTYIKERKKEAGRKSGLAAGTGKRWKYSAVLSFLDPFVTPRETSGNMGLGVEEERTAEYTQDEDEGEVGEAGTAMRSW